MTRPNSPVLPNEQGDGEELRERLSILAQTNYNSNFDTIVADVDYLTSLIQAREQEAERRGRRHEIDHAKNIVMGYWKTSEMLTKLDERLQQLTQNNKETP